MSMPVLCAAHDGGVHNALAIQCKTRLGIKLGVSCYGRRRPHPKHWGPGLSALITDCMHQEAIARPKAAEVQYLLFCGPCCAVAASARNKWQQGAHKIRA